MKSPLMAWSLWYYIRASDIRTCSRAGSFMYTDAGRNIRFVRGFGIRTTAMQ